VAELLRHPAKQTPANELADTHCRSPLAGDNWIPSGIIARKRPPTFNSRSSFERNHTAQLDHSRNDPGRFFNTGYTTTV
jgi:hypothetical protein